MSDSLTKIRKLTPLLDCDLIVYRVGFAAEKDEPIENVLHSVKMVVANALAPFDSKAELYISGSGNFRNEIAKTKPYKGNRLDTPKPQYYNEIREYLIKYHKAIPTDGIEPDDMQGIRQYELKGKSCIISIDKDMKMIKGWHYNFVKGEAKFIDGLAAERWFFTQLLTGDPTDNIQGVPKIGPKTAEKLLDESDNPDGWFEVCKREYRRYYGEDEWQSKLSEMAQLLWILRKRDSTCPWILTKSSPAVLSVPPTESPSPEQPTAGE